MDQVALRAPEPPCLPVCQHGQPQTPSLPPSLHGGDGGADLTAALAGEVLHGPELVVGGRPQSQHLVPAHTQYTHGSVQFSL